MRIPPKAQKVFQGVIFSVYQWDQEMFDGSKKTFEIVARNGGVDSIVVDGDRILLMWQEQPTKPLFPSFPGGGIEEGENALQAVQRELLLETGYRASEWKVLREYHGGQKMYFPETVFVARGVEKVQDAHPDAGEKIRCEWVDFDTFLQLSRQVNFAMALEFRFELHECLLDGEKKEKLRLEIFST